MVTTHFLTKDTKKHGDDVTHTVPPATGQDRPCGKNLGLVLLVHLPGKPKWLKQALLAPCTLCDCSAPAGFPRCQASLEQARQASVERQMTGIQSDRGSLQIISPSGAGTCLEPGSGPWLGCTVSCILKTSLARLSPYCSRSLKFSPLPYKSRQS